MKYLITLSILFFGVSVSAEKNKYQNKQASAIKFYPLLALKKANLRLVNLKFKSLNTENVNQELLQKIQNLEKKFENRSKQLAEETNSERIKRVLRPEILNRINTIIELKRQAIKQSKLSCSKAFFS